MAIDPQTLLAGPRGRRLCFEYLAASASESGMPEGEAARMAIFWAAHQHDPNPGTLIRIGGGDGPFDDPVVGAGDLEIALAAVDMPMPTAELLRFALAMSVDNARYWQPPDGTDVLAAAPELMPVLERVAEVIAASPHAAWWTTPVDLDDQWALAWEGDGIPDADTDADATRATLATWRTTMRENEERWQRERAADPAARWSGDWWSTPPSSLIHTTRSLLGEGPAELWFVEDGFGWDSAVATPVDGYPASVIEIDAPDDWVRLCRQHPLVVTASRRDDWHNATGRSGGWVHPDWAAMAEEADAVHLTVRGYLTTAGRALEVDDGWATVLANWGPDTTYWFGSTASRPADQRAWHRTDDGWLPGAAPE